MPLTVNDKNKLINDLLRAINNIKHKLGHSKSTTADTRKLVLLALQNDENTFLDNLKSNLPSTIQPIEEESIRISLKYIHRLDKDGLANAGNISQEEVSNFVRSVLVLIFEGIGIEENLFKKYGRQAYLGVEDSVLGLCHLVRHPMVTAGNFCSAVKNPTKTFSDIGSFAWNNPVRFFASIGVNVAIGNGLSAACKISGVSSSVSTAASWVAASVPESIISVLAMIPENINLISQCEYLTNILSSVGVEGVVGIAVSSPQMVELSNRVSEFFIRPTLRAPQMSMSV